MVLPLKLTQFYGHSVPRPRLYPNPKFSDHRVDPPPSVNDALLSWAHDAHWSMGGLSFKHMRMQGKIEGSIRRLRAEMEKSKRRRKLVDAAALSETDSGSDEGDSEPVTRPVESVLKKRKRGDAEATPVSARKVKHSRDDDSPKFVPATQERKKSSSPVSPAPVAKPGNDSSSPVKAPASRQSRGSDSLPLRRSPRSAGDNNSPTFVPSSREKRSTPAVLRGTPSTDQAAVSPGVIPLTRQAVRSSKDRTGEGAAPKEAVRKARVRKMLLKDDSSDSDDGIEEFLKQKDRPLRRSTRRKSGAGAETRARSSDSDSDNQ